jgi:hypothetical protein
MIEENKSWPEFVGEDANTVADKLQAEGITYQWNPTDNSNSIRYILGYQTEIMPKDSPCTRDYRLDRVRLFVDDNNKIVQTPTNG